MKINNVSFILLGLSLLLISCKPNLDDKLDVKNYKKDLKDMVSKYENMDILIDHDNKKHISPTEYNEMINFLSNEDSLMLVKNFTYFNILSRIRYHEKIKKELEEKKKKEELEKIAFKTQYVTIYFRDTKEEVEKKIKMDADSTFATFYIRKGEKDYRINLGACDTYFNYNKGYGDDKERLDDFLITLDMHSASTYKDYYVGKTKKAYNSIIQYFENQYGETNHYYPDLSSYGSGYGDRFTVAKWNIGRTSIEVEMSEKKELWDEYGYDSYKTKYIVQAMISNFDKNLRGNENE